MYFLVNVSPKPLDIATLNMQVHTLHRSHDVEGTGQILCNHDLKG